MLVFVYGTLKEGYGNNYHLRNSRKVCEATISGYSLFYSYGARSFPVAFPGDASIKGEVWDISEHPEALQSMDRLEGVPHMYTREVAKTNCGLDVSLYVGARKSWLSSSMDLVPVNLNNEHEWN